ncbi:recombinase family protein [Nonomuraea sp. NPDC050556]|uniref:recombinase family protein n=1 Tax=Nonomuraea sp. NPDC050556 TaxID=3364369 RepID=UPI0037AC3C17
MPTGQETPVPTSVYLCDPCEGSDLLPHQPGLRGTGLGVARQEANCRTLVKRRGWQVVGVYPDNDVSAYSGNPRLAWHRLLDDIEARIIDTIACWHVDGLTRSPASWKTSWIWPPARCRTRHSHQRDRPRHPDQPSHRPHARSNNPPQALRALWERIACAINWQA